MSEIRKIDCGFKAPKVLKSVRYSLAAINGVYLLTGFMLLIVGYTVLGQYLQYGDFLTNRFFSVSRFVVATGVIILVGSGLGFYSAISQRFYFVAGYVALLLITLIFEIAITISAYSLSNDTMDEIRVPMMQTQQRYFNSLQIRKLWDDLQLGFRCCGMAGRFNWKPNQIPVSCCFIEYGIIYSFECTRSNAINVGCATVLGEWLSYNAYVIAVCALVATCLQALLLLIAGYLVYRSKFEEVEVETPPPLLKTSAEDATVESFQSQESKLFICSKCGTKDDQNDNYDVVQ